MGDPSAERVARNDAAFRDANRAIADAAQRAGMEPIPLICECASEACTQIIRVSRAHYARVRKNSRWFVNAPGHDANAGGHVRVVEQYDGYVFVETTGEAGELVERVGQER